MRHIAGLFIFSTLAYNLIDLQNDKYGFIDAQFMKDIWYCLLYLTTTYFFYINRKKDTLLWVAFLASLCRLVYNFLIMIKAIEYEDMGATYGVPFFVIIILLYYKIKDTWQYLRSDS